MKNLLSILLLLPLGLFAQDGRNLVKDGAYKHHSDSASYYYNAWINSGRRNPVYEKRMLYWRKEAMERSWRIYDSTSKAKKP